MVSTRTHLVKESSSPADTSYSTVPQLDLTGLGVTITFEYSETVLNYRGLSSD